MRGIVLLIDSLIYFVSRMNEHLAKDYPYFNIIGNFFPIKCKFDGHSIYLENHLLCFEFCCRQNNFFAICNYNFILGSTFYSLFFLNYRPFYSSPILNFEWLTSVTYLPLWMVFIYSFSFNSLSIFLFSIFGVEGDVFILLWLHNSSLFLFSFCGFVYNPFDLSIS